MAKCYNCSKPAMYVIGEAGKENVPLCLDCWARHEQIVDMNLDRLERQANFAADALDDALGGPRSGARYPPRRQPVHVRQATFTSINVKDSNVGIINTGHLQQVDTAVSVIASQGDTQLATALKAITEAVLGSASIPEATKKELIELLSAISAEASVPPDQRRAAVARPLIDRVRAILSTSADVATIGQALQVILAAFGISS